MLCSIVDDCQHFGGIFCLHDQGKRQNPEDHILNIFLMLTHTASQSSWFIVLRTQLGFELEFLIILVISLLLWLCRTSPLKMILEQVTWVQFWAEMTYFSLKNNMPPRYNFSLSYNFISCRVKIRKYFKQ
jgi:hypothetical protein